LPSNSRGHSNLPQSYVAIDEMNGARAAAGSVLEDPNQKSFLEVENDFEARRLSRLTQDHLDRIATPLYLQRTGGRAMKQHSAKDRAEPRQDEETFRATNAQRALGEWWGTLSPDEQRALQGPERRRRWRRRTQAGN